jgi:pyruvate,water dikinase
MNQLGTRKQIRNIGAKADQLNWLMRKGKRVPRTYVLPFKVHDAYQQDGKAVRDALAHLISGTIDTNLEYAIRSSANVEDRTEHSFAGQFVSILNVSGLDAILDAVEEVFKAVENPKVQTYLDIVGCYNKCGPDYWGFEIPSFCRT